MATNKNGWTVSMTGECMITRKASVHDEPEFLKLKEVLDNSDVAVGHLQMNLGKYRDVYAARGNYRGNYLLADPKIAEEMKWLGFDLVSAASDHSFDFGPEGVKSTMKACDDAGLVCAGIGRNKDEAREPKYWENTAGRVAMVSMSTGNISTEWANLSNGDMATRPGPNPMRVKVRYYVPEEEGETLRKMGKALGSLREWKPGRPSGMTEGEFRVMWPTEQSTHGAQGTVSVFMKSADGYGAESHCDNKDLTGNLRQIAEASNMSDLVIVSHHYNIYECGYSDKAPMYAVEFAHAAIDAGADIYYGHGWNKMMGFEIYKGKPIFYGLGNFIAQDQFVEQLPSDSYEKYSNGNDDLMVSDPSMEPKHLDKPDISWWTSILAQVSFDAAKQVKSIVFYPVELGVDLDKEDVPVNRFTGNQCEGRPFLARGKGADRILNTFAELAKLYGNEVKIENGLACWNA